jgi:hypothetical protein
MQKLLRSQAGYNNEPKSRVYSRPDPLVRNIAEIVSRCFVCYSHNVFSSQLLFQEVDPCCHSRYYDNLSSGYSAGTSRHRLSCIAVAQDQGQLSMI